MSHDPLDHGRRNVVLGGSAAMALGLAGRAGQPRALMSCQPACREQSSRGWDHLYVCGP